MPQLYKLNYFAMHGRGEAIRVALHKAGVEYENQLITNWPEVKPTMPNGQVPVLDIIGGPRLVEGSAILRFIGQSHGLYPDDPLDALKVDEAVDSYYETLGKLYPPQFAQVPSDR